MTYDYTTALKDEAVSCETRRNEAAKAIAAALRSKALKNLRGAGLQSS